MKDSKIIDGNCWVACCDLLGFKKRIYEFEKSGVGYLRAFTNNIFNTVTDAFQRQRKYNLDHVFSTWFSDTFLFFAHGDSKSDFEWVNSSFRIFCWEMISKEWPLRGAIGFGQLYADQTRNIFLGSGIIDAHEYAEKKKQDWIGVVVTPQANKRLSELGVDLSQRRAAFTKYPVPFHQQESRNDTLELFVSKIHHNRPDVIKAVKIMQQEAMKDKHYRLKHRMKYENTLKFFEKHP
jgi:hypothetical protein